jgi:hypothetical protein
MSVYDHLEFRHLKYILAIVEAGTFTAAAASLHVAQSALSRQIRELEDVLGVQIFEPGSPLLPLLANRSWDSRLSCSVCARSLSTRYKRFIRHPCNPSALGSLHSLTSTYWLR